MIAQIFGQFNDQAFKQIVILLAMAAVAGEAEKQERTAVVTMMLLIPLTVISLPAGVLADRMSKRSVIVAMKFARARTDARGCGGACIMQPQGGWLSIAVLGLIGVQTAFFVPAKYGILPEILPYERLSAGNGLLEMTSNLAMLAGIVGGRGHSRSSAGSPVGWGADPGWSRLPLACWRRSRFRRSSPPAAEGGLGTTVRLAWESIRADRVLRLALIGQIFVWTIATLVPPVVLAYDATHLGLSEMPERFPAGRARRSASVSVACWPASCRRRRWNMACFPWVRSVWP